MGKKGNFVFSIIIIILIILIISLFLVNKNQLSDLQKDFQSLNNNVQSNYEENKNRIDSLDESLKTKTSIEEVIENIGDCITETDRTDETSGGRKNTVNSCNEVCAEKGLTCTSALFIELGEVVEGTRIKSSRQITCTEKPWIATYSVGAELDCTCC
tara:strand:- start:244 stop:714 length:471 start_codon:yes stop_codon:yes gene_type:complete